MLIGVTTEHLTTHDEEAPWMKFISYLCTGFFFIELIMRLVLHKVNYFLMEERNWNCFDFTLVALSIVDLIMEIVGSGASSVGSSLKTIKMLRIVRIFRVFRFFKELSLLAAMIADSVKSLLWALVMLTIIIYVFAICFTQGVTAHMVLKGEDPLLMAMFGSLGTTVYSLIMAMLGGIDWGEVSTPLMDVGGIMFCLFMFYIFFVLLAVLNIITGVFVDNAVETAKSQRDFIIQRAREQDHQWAQSMKQLFIEMDEDESGTVSWMEMESHFQDLHVQGLFSMLGLNPTDLAQLFKLIDDDESGEVNIDEFLDGCLRLRGEAKSVDVHAVIRANKKIEGRLEGLEVDIGKSLECLELVSKRQMESVAPERPAGVAERRCPGPPSRHNNHIQTSDTNVSSESYNGIYRALGDAQDSSGVRDREVRACGSENYPRLLT
jgi:Ca2+-binding EF-hand superfamily protein